jgi:hypothetical protein
MTEKSGPLPPVTYLMPNQPAPAGHPCDICLETIRVRWIQIPATWTPYDLSLVPVWRICSICESCMRDDGGIVTTNSRNGYVVYRCGSFSRWPGRLVIMAGGGILQ